MKNNLKQKTPELPKSEEEKKVQSSFWVEKLFTNAPAETREKVVRSYWKSVAALWHAGCWTIVYIVIGICEILHFQVFRMDDSRIPLQKSTVGRENCFSAIWDSYSHRGFLGDSRLFRSHRSSIVRLRIYKEQKVNLLQIKTPHLQYEVFDVRQMHLLAISVAGTFIFVALYLSLVLLGMADQGAFNAGLAGSISFVFSAHAMSLYKEILGRADEKDVSKPNEWQRKNLMSLEDSFDRVVEVIEDSKALLIDVKKTNRLVIKLRAKCLSKANFYKKNGRREEFRKWHDLQVRMERDLAQGKKIVLKVSEIADKASAIKAEIERSAAVAEAEELMISQKVRSVAQETDQYIAEEQALKAREEKYSQELSSVY